MIQLGQHPAPTHTVAHLSDPHFLAGNRPLFGAVDTEQNLVRTLEQLERAGERPGALLFTGDLADLGEPEAYARLRAIVDPVAERLGTRVIWVMGNHDERAPFQAGLLGEEGTAEPQDRVYDIDGLRIIALDTTVPGYHHGELTEEQLAWLADQLSTPAEHGTLLAMHHPPIPTPLPIMALLELRDQPALERVVRGTDVRGILAGHLHYSTHGTFAGVPVSVASASCYTLDVSAPRRTMRGVSGGQAFTMVHVYRDSLVHSVVPVGDFAQVSGFSRRFVENLAAMSPEDRIDAFSRKSSTVTIADVEARNG